MPPRFPRRRPQRFAATSCTRGRAIRGDRLGLLLVAGALWAGVGTEWKFLAPPTSPRPPGAGHRRQARRSPSFPSSTRATIAAREYFADGLTQDIINALGRFSELTVMSWNAVLPYRSKPANPAGDRPRLAVRYQVEGSVLRDRRPRAGDGAARRCRGPGAVVGPLRRAARRSLRPAGQDHDADRRRARDPGDRDRAAAGARQADRKPRSLRLRAARAARAAAPDARRRSWRRARLLRRAIELDPNYAAAYAALAETYFIATSMGWAESPTEYLEPRRRNGEQGAESRRVRRARARHPRPHPYLLSSLRRRRRRRSTAPSRSTRTMPMASPAAAIS